jgi:hypothetical protein
MPQTMRRKALAIAIDLQCRDAASTLILRHGARVRGYRPLGKSWRTLRRGDSVLGPDGYEYIVKRLMLQEAEPPLAAPIEIESVAAWTTSGLRR